MSTVVDLEPSFVLHTRPYRETSLLVEVFSRNAGRVGMIAKGARRSKSPLRGILQPFSPLLLSWRIGRELCPLTGAERRGESLPHEKALLLNGFYINELLMRLLSRSDPHPELFDAYCRALEQLQQGAAVEPVLRVFEKHLLKAIGYGMLLEVDAQSGEAIANDQIYHYLSDVGPVRDCVANSAGVRISGSSLQALAQERDWAPDVLSECKRLMRFLITAQLEGRELNSRALFQQTKFKDVV